MVGMEQNSGISTLVVLDVVSDDEPDADDIFLMRDEDSETGYVRVRRAERQQLSSHMKDILVAAGVLAPRS